jgi:hypothetical protein
VDAGKVRAQATANSVMASADRLIEVRHLTEQEEDGEISVPA